MTEQMNTDPISPKSRLGAPNAKPIYANPMAGYHSQAFLNLNPGNKPSAATKAATLFCLPAHRDGWAPFHLTRSKRYCTSKQMCR